MASARQEVRLLSGRSQVQLLSGAPVTATLSNKNARCLIIGRHGSLHVVAVLHRGKPALRYLRDDQLSAFASSIQPSPVLAGRG